MMTREELETAKKEELNAWRERREKELVAEGFPEYVGDVTEMTDREVMECKEEYIEKFVDYRLDREEPDVSDAIDEKYREIEELLDEDEAEE